jgi:hypothetical protein
LRKTDSSSKDKKNHCPFIQQSHQCVNVWKRWNQCLEKYLHFHAHYSMTHSSHNTETTQVSWQQKRHCHYFAMKRRQSCHLLYRQILRAWCQLNKARHKRINSITDLSNVESTNTEFIELQWCLPWTAEEENGKTKQNLQLILRGWISQ